MSKTFRVFVSSTFSDLKLERDALQLRVFPRLREFCAQHGARFQAIDLRWGVSEEASRDQQTMNICLGEIERCQQITPRPNFIVLLGDRYGWRPPPPQIPAEEYEGIYKICIPEEKALLDDWYRRDDNAVPPEYVMQPWDAYSYEQWAEIERELHDTLEHRAKSAGMDPQALFKYWASATHQEIAAGALSPQAEPEHVFAFFRQIDGLPEGNQAASFRDLDQAGRPDEGARRRLDGLKAALDDALAGNVKRYITPWTANGPADDHIDRLCADVYDTLKGVIAKQLAGMEELDPLEAEIAAHEAFGRERARFFIGRRETLARIAEYIADTARHPLAVWGEAGSGKSTLLVRAVQQVREAHPGAVLIYRFIGATPESSSGHALLRSLCSQISRRYGADESDIPLEYRDLAREFPARLGLATGERPLLLFLDAVDQVSATDKARSLLWLPRELPQNVRLIVSTVPGECKTALEAKLPPELVVELKPMSEDEAEELLDRWLEDTQRTLQPEQRQEVLGNYAHCPKPLYLRLAFDEARRWTSYQRLPTGASGAPGLGHDIPGIIRDLFARLSSQAHHGEMLIARSLGYLAAARNGLTEDELLDVLARDSDVYAWFLRSLFHTPPDLLRQAQAFLDEKRGSAVNEAAAEAWLQELRKKWNQEELSGILSAVLADGAGLRLPVVLWSRLYADLEPYLAQRAADGTRLLGFYHRQVREVAAEDYLSEGSKLPRHRALAAYFGSQSLEIGGGRRRRRNLRMLSELPYQQAYAEMWGDLFDTLTGLGFLYAKIGAFGPLPLLEDYDHAYAAGYAGRDLGLIQDALRLSLYPLSEDENLLPGQLVGRLMLQKTPGLRKLHEQALLWRRAPWLRPLTPSLIPPGSPLVRTITGHAKRVTDVALTEDGEKVLTASDDGTIKLWYFRDGCEIRTLRGHRGEVTSVAVVPGSKRAVSGSSDKTVKVWDLDSGEELATLEGHEGAVTDVLVTPDKKQAISCSLCGEIIFWSLETGAALDKVTGHEGRVYCLATTPDWRYLVSGAEDRTMRVWDTRQRTEINVLRGHEDSVWAACVTPDGEHAVSASWDKAISIWNLETGEKVRTLRGHTDRIQALALTGDGKYIISAAVDKTLKVWSFDTGELLHSFSTIFIPNGLAATPDGHHAVVGARDAEIWDLRGDTKAKLVPDGHTEDVTSIALHPHGSRALSASYDTTIREWDLDSGKVVRTLRAHTAPVSAVSISENGQRVLSGSFDQTARLWDYKSGTVLKTLEGHEHLVDAVALSSSGEIAATADRDGVLRVWDLRSGGPGTPLQSPPCDWIMALAISPDGNYIASGEWSGMLKLWDIKGKRLINQHPGHKDRVTSVRFSRRGDEVISASADGSIKLWAVPFWQLVLAIEGHKNIVESAVLTPDRRFVISCSDDKMLKLWDIVNERLYAAFCGYGPLVDCACSTDGEKLVVAETAGWIHTLHLERV